ncbi:hypothetical protein DFH09DRAFT_1344534 [Mycena vulgaris]|nr:hypothetical protein DFH09DRAFT_1344534 [Mycena vulgaris]
MADSSPLAHVRPSRRPLPPSDPFSEWEEDDLPGLADIQCSDDEADEHNDDSDDSDDEDGSPPVVNRGSSPLTALPESEDEESGVATPRQAPLLWASPLTQFASSPIPGVPVMLSSSPMYSPRLERKLEIARREAQRQATRAANKLAAETAQIQEEKEREEVADAAEQKKKAHFAEVLDGLQEKKYSLADLLEYTFNPATQFASGFDWRWRGFFAHKHTVTKIFGYWSSNSSRAARTFIVDWAYDLVKKMVSSESRRITRSGILSKVKKTINEDFFLKYSLTGLSQTVARDEPTGVRHLRCIFYNLAGMWISSPVLIKWSQSKQFRQHFSILHGFGWSMGYTSIVSSQPSKPPGSTKSTTDLLDEIDGLDPPVPGRHARRNQKNRQAKKAKKAKRIRGPGTLSLLSDACRTTARVIASSGLFLIMYDNINMMVRIAEQILGRKNTQENGTCATVVPLHDAKLDDLLTSTLDESIANAEPLSIEHLEFTEVEGMFFHKNMIHTILR